MATEEAFVQDRSPMNLADLRSQLERYRSRLDHFDQATREVIAIPPIKTRICEKGYLAYIFQNDSNATLCARVIRLPSTCNGVTRGEWVFDLGMSPPEVVVLGMTLQPDLNLLVVVVSTDEYTCVSLFTFAAIGLTIVGVQGVAGPHPTTLRRQTTPCHSYARTNPCRTGAQVYRLAPVYHQI
jgi:hypothetical protein